MFFFVMQPQLTVRFHDLPYIRRGVLFAAVRLESLAYLEH